MLGDGGSGLSRFTVGTNLESHARKDGGLGTVRAPLSFDPKKTSRRENCTAGVTGKALSDGVDVSEKELYE
jgi:hypothetical protein